MSLTLDTRRLSDPAYLATMQTQRSDLTWQARDTLDRAVINALRDYSEALEADDQGRAA